MAETTPNAAGSIFPDALFAAKICPDCDLPPGFGSFNDGKERRDRSQIRAV